MDKLLFSAIIGLVAGVIDIIPMVMQKLPRYSIVSAFSITFSFQSLFSM